MNPLLNALLYILTIGGQNDIAGSVKDLKALNASKKLHTVVGRALVTATELLMMLTVLEYDTVTTRTRIAQA